MDLKDNVKYVTKENLMYLIFNQWETNKELIHCFTTRLGGASTGYLTSLNLGFNRGDNKDHVIENYQRVCDALNVNLGSLVLSTQIHETNIVKVKSEDIGNGILHSSKWESADGMYTRERNITLVTHYADCVPLLFYAPRHSIIGMAHAGWRGTVKEIAKKLVTIWGEAEAVPAADIQVAIGPSIGPCCFEVDGDVAHEFISEFGEKSFIKNSGTSQKYHINLWEANKQILISAGVKEENIAIAGVCTSCHDDLYFSHRKSNGKRGTLGAFMALK